MPVAKGMGRTLTIGQRSRRYLLRHTFSGASLTPSDQGPPLTAYYATPTVSGGVLVMDPASITVGVWNASVGANVDAQVRVNFGNSAGASRRVLLQIRMSDVNDNTIEAVINRADDSLALWRRDASVVTVLAGVSSVGLQDSTDYWLRLRAVGNQIEVFTSLNGTTWTRQMTVTEALYASNAGVGARLIDDGTKTITLSDFVVWRAP